MADRIDNLTKRVEIVETKLDRLSASVDQRFDAVDAALLEQRQYTEFAYSRLEAKMDAGFGRVDAAFGRVDAAFGRVDARFGRVDAGFSRVDARFDRIERKLDRFIDVQLQTNQLVERRLRALEEQRGPGQAQ